eukprot:m.241804 g.241804  ORF g.241804 m.241804 type:complete len:119 (-) comp19425_c0_seq2:360-716(-)
MRVASNIAWNRATYFDVQLPLQFMMTGCVNHTVFDTCGHSHLPVQRMLGMLRNGTNDVKDHKWFSSMDWIALYHRELKPEYVPKVRGAGDASHYDQYEEDTIPTSEVSSCVRCALRFR